MTFSASGDTPKINYTLLFNTSIPSTPTLKLALLTICIRLISWIATSLKITSNFQQKLFSNQQTDTHKLLHPKSYHPAHVFKGIVKVQLLGYIRLSSHFDDFMHIYAYIYYHTKYMCAAGGQKVVVVHWNLSPGKPRF